MADLNTKSLDEYPTIEETADGDTVLIERDGRIKRLSASSVGGKGVVIDITEETSSSLVTLNVITLSNEKFNTLLKVLDNFSTVYLKYTSLDRFNDESTVVNYDIVIDFEYDHDTSGTYTPSYVLTINKSNYNFSPTSETGLYVPQNIVINEVYMNPRLS